MQNESESRALFLLPSSPFQMKIIFIIVTHCPPLALYKTKCPNVKHDLDLLMWSPFYFLNCWDASLISQRAAYTVPLSVNVNASKGRQGSIQRSYLNLCTWKDEPMSHVTFLFSCYIHYPHFILFLSFTTTKPSWANPPWLWCH